MNETENQATQEIPASNATEKTSAEKELLLCPCCQKKTLDPPLKVSGELLDHFMSCIMTGVPYNREYPVYKDRLRITVTILPRDTSFLLQRLTIACKEFVKLFPEQEPAINAFCVAVDQYIAIEEIKVGADDSGSYAPADHVKAMVNKVLLLPHNPDNRPDFDALLAELTRPAMVSSVPISMLLMVTTAHTQLYQTIVSAGFDPNFWEGIVLV